MTHYGLVCVKGRCGSKRQIKILHKTARLKCGTVKAKLKKRADIFTEQVKANPLNDMLYRVDSGSHF